MRGFNSPSTNQFGVTCTYVPGMVFPEGFAPVSFWCPFSYGSFIWTLHTWLLSPPSNSLVLLICKSPLCASYRRYPINACLLTHLATKREAEY